MVSSGQTTKTRQKTHVEFNAVQVSASTSELLGLGLDPRKGVVVQDDCHSGFLQCLQPALLNTTCSAGDSMHDLKRDRDLRGGKYRREGRIRSCDQRDAQRSSTRAEERPVSAGDGSICTQTLLTGIRTVLMPAATILSISVWLNQVDLMDAVRGHQVDN